jgi:20S proteasome subunit beta 1
LLGAGSAADNQILARYVKNYTDQFSMELGGRPLVRSVAHLFHRIGYFNKNGLLSSLIVCGWDDIHGQQIYAVPTGGAIIPRSKFYVSGSGGGIITGYLDAHWKPNMSYQEAQDLLLRAIGLSVKHDAASGGGIRFTNICKEEMKENFCGYNEIPRYE